MSPDVAASIKARIHVQLDFGFGDAVVPAPVEIEYPTLLPTLLPPRIRAYRREVSLAEKFEAMVTLGLRNSRMKDFHDVWALSSAFSFEIALLSEAVIACFVRRGTAWTEEPPHVLGTAFYENHDGTYEYMPRYCDVSPLRPRSRPFRRDDRQRRLHPVP